MRIVRRLAVFLLVAAPIGFVIGTTEAGAVTNTTSTTFSPAPPASQVYGAETIGTTPFTAVVTGTGPISDFPEGTLSIVANPGNITICSSDFASGTTTVTSPNITNYTCTGSGGGTTLNAGTYTIQAQFAAGSPSASLVGFVYTSSNSATDPYVVTQTAPTALTTVQVGPYLAGQTVSDTDTLTGAVNATGNVTFTLYNGSGTCSTGSGITTTTAIVAASGSLPATATETTLRAPNTTATAFSIFAQFAGDTNNGGPDNAPCEGPFTTVPAVPTINPTTGTVATSATLGSAIQDTVNITGLSGTNATGLVTVTAQSGTCSGPVAYSATVGLNPLLISGTTGTVVVPFTPLATGTYVWSVFYAGDANNAPVAEACGVGTNETSTVSGVPSPPPGLFINNGFLPSVMHGRLYSVQLTASGGAAPPHDTWSLSAVGFGQQLPPGIHVNPATGVLSGTAGVAGHYTFTVTVTDSTSPATTTSQTYHLTIT